VFTPHIPLIAIALKYIVTVGYYKQNIAIE